MYEASDKLRPSATQGLSGIYTEIADDFHPRRTLSAKGTEGGFTVIKGGNRRSLHITVDLSG